MLLATSAQAVSPGFANPYAAVVQGSDGLFYGTGTTGGVGTSTGCIFQINGTTIKTLKTFNGTGTAPQGSYGGLVQGTDGKFYGTTMNGGAHSMGTFYSITSAGVFTVLYSFDGTHGSHPEGSLVLGSDGNFYGTTNDGGSTNDGTIFKITPTGTLTSLLTFNGTNGAGPVAGLTAGSSGVFYGTTTEGGTGFGNVFKFSTTTGVLTSLANFDDGPNGAYPNSGVALAADGSLYGTTIGGDATPYGTVYKIAADGSLHTLLTFNFTNGAGAYGTIVKAPDGKFYGTTYSGGLYSAGTIFSISSSGSVTTTYNFNISGTPNVAAPRPGLIVGADSKLYGLANSGGNNGNGAFFQLTTPSGVADKADF